MKVCESKKESKSESKKEREREKEKEHVFEFFWKIFVGIIAHSHMCGTSSGTPSERVEDGGMTQAWWA